MKTMAILPGDVAVIFSADGQRLPVLWSLGSPRRLFEVKNGGLCLIITLRDMLAMVLNGANMGMCHITRLRRCCVAATQHEVEYEHGNERRMP